MLGRRENGGWEGGIAEGVNTTNMMRSRSMTGPDHLHQSCISISLLTHELTNSLVRHRAQRFTTRVSSFKNSRRYLIISAAMPLGSLMRRLRRSVSTPRSPSFQSCFSSAVLPGLAVPSWTSSFSPRLLKLVCAQESE